MSREQFETTEDRARQEVLRGALERTFKLKLKPLANAHYTLDFFAYDPKGCVGKAWVEVKCRNIAWGQYDAIMLSAGKWRDGVTFSQTSGLPFILFFQFKGGEVYRYLFNPKHIGTEFDQERRANADTTKLLMPYGTQEVDKNGLWFDGKLWVSPGVWLEWGGRTLDDRDGQDAEPVVMIANSLWERVAIEPEPVRDTSFDKPEPTTPPAEALPPPAEQKTDDHPF